MSAAVFVMFLITNQLQRWRIFYSPCERFI